MTSSAELWTAFGQMVAMLFMVLALLLAGFYLLRKMTAFKGMKGGKELIRVLTVHHLSPKEKLVLVEVLEETILVGVTASGISKISSFGKRPDLHASASEKIPGGFAGMLSRRMKADQVTSGVSSEGKHDA